MSFHGVAMKMIVIVTLMMGFNVNCFMLSRPINFPRERFAQTNPVLKSKSASQTKLNMDITLVPMIVGATGLIFAGTGVRSEKDNPFSLYSECFNFCITLICLWNLPHLQTTVFNFDNKIDLTDSGLAKAKSIRYNARKERGEIPSKEAVANMDPYRWYARFLGNHKCSL